MTKRELIQRLEELDIRPNTVSFYVATPEECDDEGDCTDGESEAFFGTCDISGIRGDIVHCMALNSKNEVVRFDAGTWLVHGHLGKLAGAF